MRSSTEATWLSGVQYVGFVAWHIASLAAPRAKTLDLCQLSGRRENKLTGGNGPVLSSMTHLCHRLANFAVMHHVAFPTMVR
jgi:hypothetical protein